MNRQVLNKRDANPRDACPLSERPGRACAGLPGAPEAIERLLRQIGIDPDRLSILHFGFPKKLAGIHALWLLKFILGILLYVSLWLIEYFKFSVPQGFIAVLYLIAGLVLLQIACEVLVITTEKFAARLNWDHYIAGTIAEILSTLPELVVIAFIIPISPIAAFVIALITIYNNALVFSLYSFFLPKDKMGKFLMPKPITEAGTQILIAGAGVSLIVGLVLLTFYAAKHPKSHFEAHDLIILGLLLLIIFSVYIFKLVRDYAKEEQIVRSSLQLNANEIKKRKSIVYTYVKPSSLPVIGLLFVVGIAGAMMGGHSISQFANIVIHKLGFNPMVTALFMAVFAGMSEYVILWTSHTKKEYGIALANAFGGITQVMFLVLPFTLISIGIYQLFINGTHTELPLAFDLSYILLLIFLFPTFFVLFELIEEDHTLGILDATIMTSIFVLVILILVTYGAYNMK